MSTIVSTRRPESSALKKVLYFANLRPTERSWRRDLLRPFKQLLVGGVLPPALPDTAVFGVSSQQDLVQQLTGYRSVLDRLITARNYRDPQGRTLWASVSEAAKLK